MFEYIKRVSVAVSFISEKIDLRGERVKSILDTISLDLLLIAQNFRTDTFSVRDLQKLEHKISYLIDIIDFARISSLISEMNANVFVDSQIAFLKHIINLTDQKNSLSLPIYQLKQLDESMARKNAKESLQNRFAFSDLDMKFSEMPNSFKKENLKYNNIPVATQTQTQKPVETFSQNNSKIEDEQIDVKEAPKKILEESVLYPQGNPGRSPENVENEIGNRRKRILQALSTGGGSIREISVKLKDVNEKTLQRDLLELMKDKKVIMLGKKRWSKYYLK
jgi:hypothetical protein